MSRLTDGRPARSRAMSERRRTVIVWGATDSGKSGVIGALRSEATKTVGDRWALDLADAANRLASPDVVAYADSASLALRLRGVKETVIRRPERAFTVTIGRHVGRRTADSIDLTVLDPRGELAAEPASRTARQLLAASRTADGLLWLIEAPLSAKDGVSQLQLLRQIVALLDAADATELDVPVIVALTKIDRLPQAEMQRLLEAPEAALRQLLGDAAFGWLLAAFPRLRCAAISAAGTVRNAVRPVGLTTAIDTFSNEWRREDQAADAARVRARRSARVARVRHRAPIAATIAAGAAIIAFAGVATARLLQQRDETWSSSAGAVASHTDSGPTSTQSARPAPDTVRSAPPSLTSAAARLDSGNVLGALQMLADLRVPDSSGERIASDSLLAIAALREMETALAGRVPDLDPLQLVIVTTTAAIARAHPGTAVLAPLSLARAGACIGARLNCPAEQVREDLAWAVILGTPAQQDQARRLRGALVGDTLVTR